MKRKGNTVNSPNLRNPATVTPPKAASVVARKRLTVTKAAQMLGVSRTHLSLVLHGHRKSRRLLHRYQHLLKHS